jgi:hypothetical protein
MGFYATKKQGFVEVTKLVIIILPTEFLFNILFFQSGYSNNEYLRFELF